MSQLKTKPEDEDPAEFIASVENEARRKDAEALLKIMTELTGEKPKMWGTSIIGYGEYHYRYKSGREGDWFLTGFSPRKASLSIYIMSGFDKYSDLLAQLGKYKTGKSCLYINKLDDVNLEVLKELILSSVSHLRAKYPA